MAGITTQSTSQKFSISFDTNTGKKKNMSFSNIDDFDSSLAEKLVNIAQALVNNTGALTVTLTKISDVSHTVTTKNTFSEAN